METNFPSKKFKKTRDQHEYDAICDAGALLQKAIQENSKEKILKAQEALRLRAFILRVAEEEEKKYEFWGFGSKNFHYTPYSPPQLQMQYTPPFQGYQNQAVFQNPGLSYQTSFNKPLKQIMCYYCGGASHTASVCASKPGEGSPPGTEKWWESISSKVLDGKDKPTIGSSLLVKKLYTSIPKRCVESDPERNPKALQIDTGSKDVVGKGGSLVGKTGCNNQSSCTGTKVRRDKSLFKDPVEEKLDDSPKISKHHGQGAEPSKGFCPSTSEVFRVLLPSGCSKQTKLEMGRKNLALRPGKNRLGLVARKPGEIQWPSGLEAVIDKDLIRRCLDDRPFCELVKRILGPNIHRQSYGFGNNEIGQKTLVAKGGLQKFVASLFGEGHLDLRDEMGSVSADRNDVWTTHNRPDGILYEHEVTKVQQLSFLPGLGSGKLLHPKVGKRGKLCVPAAPFSSEGTLSHEKLWCKNDSGDPFLDLGQIVAPTSGFKLGSNNTSRTEGHICPGPIRIRRTVEKPKVEVPRSAHSPIEELSQRARSLAKNSVSP
ncbi:5199_t:CDS:2 [Gigaspora margarita]|uniref:5199_t:CDS:1 n=1 Tax=Gigaspora margarita TaxID=4874 RepID=A0ABN7UWT2_GIGMA|nr:5199_t:CDS:2 [Gigaspora margarita]